MGNGDGGSGNQTAGSTPGAGTKRVSYRGQHYDIPLWMSASTFMKRVRAGVPVQEAMSTPPMTASAAGRRARKHSPYDSIRGREIAIAMARRALQKNGANSQVHNSTWSMERKFAIAAVGGKR